MKNLLLFVLLNGISVSWAQSFVGALAPDFKMSDHKGQLHQLSDFKDQWLVLYFYPKDDTPGCTVEAQKFRDKYDQFVQLNANIVGVSMDDQQSHAEFIKKYQLPFLLLSDTDEKVSEAYKVVGGFGPIKHAKRQTFIINPEGVVVKHYQSVSPQSHADEVFTDLQSAHDLYMDLSPKKGEKIDAYGQPWPSEKVEQVNVGAAVKDIEKYSNKPLVFTGEVTQVCQKKGCWMVLSENDLFARVDFNKHSFFIPKDSKGYAEVYGQIELKELSQKAVDHFKEDGATGITKKSYEIKALSVRLMDAN